MPGNNVHNVSNHKSRHSRTKKVQTRCELDSIVMLDKPLKEIKCFVETSLYDKTNRFQIADGILIFGPSGVGKTSVVNHLAEHYSPKINFVFSNGSSFVGLKHEKIKSTIESLFESAMVLHPSVLVFDNMEKVVPTKKKSADEPVTTFFSAIENCIAKISHSCRRIPVIGVVQSLDSINGYLTDSFFLDVEFPMPKSDERVAIFSSIMKRYEHNVPEKIIKWIAESAHGFTGGDFVQVFGRASHNCSMREGKAVDENDLKDAFRRVRPSVMKDIALQVPEVLWTDIGGMHEVKKELIKAVVWPFKNADTFVKHRRKPPKGVLMYGPPGCSKTMIGRALATEGRLNFLTVKGPELFNKYVGESERLVREIFQRARRAAPAIIFFDEIDALASERGASGVSGGSSCTVGDRVSSQLLTEIDGLVPLDNVVIVAATNRPDKIDRALLRPGRFDSIVYVPLPDLETRKEILLLNIKSMLVDDTVNENIDFLASKTEGFSGAELVSVCDKAFLAGMEEDESISRINIRHFQTALEKIVPSTDPELVKFYEQYRSKNI